MAEALTTALKTRFGPTGIALTEAFGRAGVLEKWALFQYVHHVQCIVFPVGCEKQIAARLEFAREQGYEIRLN